MKVAYLGYDLLYPALEALAAEGCDVLAVYTCQTDGVTEFHEKVTAFAKKRGIPCTTSRITKRDLDALAKAGCELLLTAGYYYRVPITDAFPMVNIHPAPLPDCRGAWPMPLILLGAYPHGGVTFHKMEESFDTGDILLEKTFSLQATDTLSDYMERACALLPDMVHAFLEELPFLLQNAKKQGRGRYLPDPTAEAWTVTPQMTASMADKILRAFYGYECIYQDDEKALTLLGARAYKGVPKKGSLPVLDGYIAVN